jgi:hypothetical protein
MRNALLIVLAIGLVAAVIGTMVLGAFPPDPHVQQVRKVLPNDRFGTH